MTEQKQINPHLVNLILSHEAAAMQSLGKIAGPDGKVSRNLELARFAIDTLEVIKEKTKGNLTADEQRMLDHVLYQLHLNFIDEAKATPEPAPAPAPAPATTEEKTSEPPATTAESPAGDQPSAADPPPDQG